MRAESQDRVARIDAGSLSTTIVITLAKNFIAGGKNRENEIMSALRKAGLNEWAVFLEQALKANGEFPTA